MAPSALPGGGGPCPGGPTCPEGSLWLFPQDADFAQPHVFLFLQIVHQTGVLLSAAGQVVLLVRQLWQGPAFSPASALVAAPFLAHCGLAALTLKWPLLYWRNR